ncbi:hypothetical protein K9U39_05065 [Rhodoblastus acidophilus]|uniref:Uncharacterized protein n=1 Tax=Candidatus Rhodoblastus alkanivorans TaxID=2954117 RepID=A0ABS9Z748_9HYPH|nr:hypothetical protein [Candidatus Rhodoblastus alkanivorans]MCI4678602.1 hypothetical protein [Candidatus Rhodoblastus alkanivorans]MCI4683012.1 hypothetical protein [Candidatus Rhodoblastus alkanivorans]MDI4640322.1 hypothetical protein [Rhodoblastus acidophilus]
MGNKRAPCFAVRKNSLATGDARTTARLQGVEIEGFFATKCPESAKIARFFTAFSRRFTTND